MKDKSQAKIENIYSLDGRVPLLKSVPFGLQHVLAMFVANIAPIMIVTGASGLDVKQTASLIQTALSAPCQPAENNMVVVGNHDLGNKDGDYESLRKKFIFNNAFYLGNSINTDYY